MQLAVNGCLHQDGFAGVTTLAQAHTARVNIAAFSRTVATTDQGRGSPLKATCIIFAAALTTLSFAGDKDEDVATDTGVIRLAANMNELALACGHMSAKDVEAGRLQQRNAAIKDMGLAPTEYDKLYASFKAEFSRQWSGVGAAQQQKTCQQVKPR